MNRPSWPTTLLAVAFTMAQRSTCPRLSTGAVVASPDNRLLATGYNGAPYNQPHCTDIGCLMESGHCVRAVHAELNAILQAACSGTPTRGASLYCTHRPCIRCAIVIVQSGISSVTYAKQYDSDRSDSEVLNLFNAANVTYRKHDDS